MADSRSTCFKMSFVSKVHNHLKWKDKICCRLWLAVFFFFFSMRRKNFIQDLNDVLLLLYIFICRYIYVLRCIIFTNKESPQQSCSTSLGCAVQWEESMIQKNSDLLLWNAEKRMMQKTSDLPGASTLIKNYLAKPSKFKNALRSKLLFQETHDFCDWIDLKIFYH